jgi:YegS/Rv2252/BmrU family lipid kinase
MSKRKVVLISNPKTGRYGSRRATIEELSDYLTSNDLDVSVLTTSAPGDATRFAHRAAHNGTSDVVVAGGDGTINEAIQGIAGTKARLAIIPRGTGNVLARELGLPLEPQQAANVVVQSKSREVHFGVAIDERTDTRRYFLLMAGIGLDASVVTNVQPSLKKRFGRAAFWFSGLSHLANWSPRAFHVEINDQTLDATFVTIGKAATYGGALAITPGAQIDKPEFEVCIIQTTSRFRYLRLLSHAIGSGLNEQKKGVRFLKATSVRAFGDAPVQVDGEVIGHLPMRFEIAPYSLEVIVP